MSRLPTYEIARVAHEINRAYCEAIGDFSQKPWSTSSPEIQESARRGVELAADDPVTCHNHWMQFKLSRGWRYGPVKDEEKREHPCLVAYSELPKEQQIKDSLFIAVVKALST